MKFLISLLFVVNLAITHSQGNVSKDSLNINKLNSQNEKHGLWVETIPLYNYNSENLTFYKRGNYSNGLRVGVWLVYNDKGEIIRLLTYKEGCLHGAVIYYHKGKPRYVYEIDSEGYIFYILKGNLKKASFHLDILILDNSFYEIIKQ